MINKTYLYVFFLFFIVFVVDALRIGLGINKVISGILICLPVIISAILLFSLKSKSQSEDSNKLESSLTALLILIIFIVSAKLLSFFLIKDTIVFILLVIAIILLVIFRDKI